MVCAGCRKPTTYAKSLRSQTLWQIITDKGAEIEVVETCYCRKCAEPMQPLGAKT